MIDPFGRFALQWRAETPEQAMLRAVRSTASRAGMHAAPHSLTRIAALLGVRIELDDVPGARLILDGPPLIVAPRSPWRTWRRQRFGIAHELAHMIVWQSLPAGSRAALGDARWHDRLERLCDQGAAELLMPGDEFRRDVTKLGFSDATLALLYDRYLVSWMSLMNRVSTVLPEAGVSMWRFGVRQGDPHDLPRVVASWGWSRDTYLPPGLSERHLSRLIVSSAFYDGQAWSTDLHLRFRARAGPVAAVACAMPTTRRDQEVLPVLDGRQIPDEAGAFAHVALLILAGEDGPDRVPVLTGASPAARPRARTRERSAGWAAA